jgi:hypothetical protein
MPVHRTNVKDTINEQGAPDPGHGDEYIEVLGARVHNLKDLDVRIPRDRLKGSAATLRPSTPMPASSSAGSNGPMWT